MCLLLELNFIDLLVAYTSSSKAVTDLPPSHNRHGRPRKGRFHDLPLTSAARPHSSAGEGRRQQSSTMPGILHKSPSLAPTHTSHRVNASPTWSSKRILTTAPRAMSSVLVIATAIYLLYMTARTKPVQQEQISNHLLLISLIFAVRLGHGTRFVQS